MYHWVEEFSPPLTTISEALFLALNNGHNRLMSLMWCSAETYESLCKASASTVTCKPEQECWEVALLDPALGPLGSYKPFGLSPFQPHILPYFGPWCFPHPPDLTPFLLCFPLSPLLPCLNTLLPPSFHTSASKMKHMRSQEIDLYWQFPYPEITERWSNHEKGLQGNLPSTHSWSPSPSMIWSWLSLGRSWSMLNAYGICKDCAWTRLKKHL